MAEAGIAVYGTVVGVTIALAVVLFAFRGKGTPQHNLYWVIVKVLINASTWN